MLNNGANFFRLEVDFKSSSWYNRGAPFCRWFSHSNFHATSFDLRICRLALLRDCVVQDLGLTGLLAYPPSASSFPLMPSCPGIHWTVIVFPSFASHVFASSRNLINVAWLRSVWNFSCFFATLELSRHMWIAGATCAIGESEAIPKPRAIAYASASYTSCVVPRASPSFAKPTSYPSGTTGIACFVVFLCTQKCLMGPLF